MDLFRCPSLYAPKSVLKLTHLSNRLKNSHQFSTTLNSSKWYISFTFKFSVPFNHEQCIFKISCNPHILSSTENRENNAKVKLSIFNIEHNNVIPNIDTCLRLAKYLDMTVEELFSLKTWHYVTQVLSQLSYTLTETN